MDIEDINVFIGIESVGVFICLCVPLIWKDRYVMTDDVMARVGGRGCGGAVAFVWGVGRFVRADRFGRDRWPVPRFARRAALERGLAAGLTDHPGLRDGRVGSSGASQHEEAGAAKDR